MEESEDLYRERIANDYPDEADLDEWPAETLFIWLQSRGALPDESDEDWDAGDYIELILEVSEKNA